MEGRKNGREEDIWHGRRMEEERIIIKRSQR